MKANSGTARSRLNAWADASGCLDAHLHSDLGKTKTLLLNEDWQSREQFERNLDAAKLNAIVGVIEPSIEAPVFALTWSSGRRA
jgi:quinol monooxygenase YgiN